MVQGAVLEALPSEPAYGRPMSIDEWERMDEDTPGELVDGLLTETEVVSDAAALL